MLNALVLDYSPDFLQSILPLLATWWWSLFLCTLIVWRGVITEYLIYCELTLTKERQERLNGLMLISEPVHFWSGPAAWQGVQASGAPYASFFFEAYGVSASCPVKTFCLPLEAPFRLLKFARTQMTNRGSAIYALQKTTTLDLTARKFLRNGVLCEDTKSQVRRRISPG